VENWKCTKYADGTPIPNVTDNTQWGALTTPAYCWLNNDSAQGYGALYNWWVVDPLNEEQLAPTDWRTPVPADWNVLLNYLIANGYNWDGSLTGNKIAKALASNGGEWASNETTGNVGNNQGSNNSSGFNGLPSGYRRSDGLFRDLKSYTAWWVPEEAGLGNGRIRAIASFYSYLDNWQDSKPAGFSVRLVRDIADGGAPLTQQIDQTQGI